MFISWIHNNLNNLIGSAIVAAFMVLAYGMIRIFLQKIVRSTQDRQIWNRRITYAAIFLSVYIIGEIWFETLRIFTALVSLIGAALIVTHKEMVVNVSAQLIIKNKHLFKIGDYISLKEYSGKVISTGWQEFTILSKASTKNGYLKIPNNFIFTHELINHSEPSEYLSYYFSTDISAESKLAYAKKVLHDIIYKHTEDLYLKLKPTSHKSKKSNSDTAPTLPEVFLAPHDSDGSLIRLDSTFLYYPGKGKKIIDLITQDWIMAVQNSPEIIFASPSEGGYRRTTKNAQKVQGY